MSAAAQRVVDIAREFCDDVHEEMKSERGGYSVCTWCDEPWPCNVQRLTDAIAAWDEGQ